MRALLTLATLLALLAQPAAGAEPAPITSVEVFANAAMVIAPPSDSRLAYSVYRIDGINQVEQLMAQDMPTGEEEAKAYFNKNYATMMKRFKPLIRNAAEGLNLALRYQLDRIPAVVINQKAVVFGVASVDQAIAEYLDHEARKAERARAYAPPAQAVPWK